MKYLTIWCSLLLLLACSENVNDSNDKNSHPTTYSHSLVSRDDIPDNLSPDSLYYEWTGSLFALGEMDTSKNIAKLDSIFTSLLLNQFPLKHAWYQYNDTQCGALQQPIAPKLYIELNKQDDRCPNHLFSCRASLNFTNCGTATFRKFVFK